MPSLAFYMSLTASVSLSFMDGSRSGVTKRWRCIFDPWHLDAAPPSNFRGRHARGGQYAQILLKFGPSV